MAIFVIYEFKKEEEERKETTIQNEYIREVRNNQQIN